MEIKQVAIENFRGIKCLNWVPNKKVACLIGPGDSTKTTILDAIELALAPLWTIPFADTDFHNADLNDSIKIEVTVGGLPESVFKEEKYGLYLRGWDRDGKLVDEPDDEDEPVLTIQLIIDDSLDPSWQVINYRDPIGRKISWKDRQLLGIARLGQNIDRHLSWGRGSSLLRLTENITELTSILAQVYRRAKDTISKEEMTLFNDSIAKATTEVKKFGIQPTTGFKPGLDTKAIHSSTGAISMFDGEIPLKMAGDGTKKLVALALQKIGISEGAILLIDEIEHGLEPYRIRHLVGLLSKLTNREDQTENSDFIGQVIMTTHSPVVVQEIPAQNNFVVRVSNGSVDIQLIGKELQDIARSNSEALLSKKIIVCEGKTEIGLFRALSNYWPSLHDGCEISAIGVAWTLGGGTHSIERCEKLRKLGFNTGLLCDSDDESFNYKLPDLKKLGIEVVQWDDKCCLEERACLDLPWKSFLQLIYRCFELRDENAFRSRLYEMSELKEKLDGIEASNWNNLPEIRDIRRMCGKVINKLEYFKLIDSGQEFGEIIVGSLSDMENEDLKVKINRLENWVYDK